MWVAQIVSKQLKDCSNRPHVLKMSLERMVSKGNKNVL